MMFNVVVTSMPVISLGVFEQDVSSEVCLQVSIIYNACITSHLIDKNLFG